MRVCGVPSTGVPCPLELIWKSLIWIPATRIFKWNHIYAVQAVHTSLPNLLLHMTHFIKINSCNYFSLNISVSGYSKQDHLVKGCVHSVYHEFAISHSKISTSHTVWRIWKTEALVTQLGVERRGKSCEGGQCVFRKKWEPRREEKGEN